MLTCDAIDVRPMSVFSRSTAIAYAMRRAATLGFAVYVIAVGWDTFRVEVTPDSARPADVAAIVGSSGVVWSR